MAPHARSVVVVGAGVLCGGAVAGYLGPLALELGDREQALALLREARSSAAGFQSLRLERRAEAVVELLEV